jgi:hypothetical protein
MLKLVKATETQAVNEVYIVDIRSEPIRPRQPRGLIHLKIRRRDAQPIHSWVDFQLIKNQLAGADCEAVELYPAESRLVDVAHQYHLFCSTDPTYRFPFGLRHRYVTGEASVRPLLATWLKS